MAETIGRAYVKILADGRGLGRDVEKELRKHEAAFENAGDRNGKSYSKAFDEAMKDSPTWANMTKALNKSVADANVTHSFFEGDAWKNLVKDMETVHGPELAEKLRLSFEKEFRRKGSLSGLEDAVENSTARISTIIEREMSETERRVAEASRKNAASTRRFFRSAEKDTERFSNTFASNFNRVADLMGAAFGRGSRNNFLNFIGSMQRNFTKAFGIMFTVAFKFFEFVIDRFSGVAKKADDATGAAAKLGEGLGVAATEGAAFTAATGGASIIAGVIALGIALEGAALSAGVLFSALSMLMGIVVALAGTIYASLIGALAALAPLIVPLAAIIGGIVAAVFEFKDANGKLETSMDRVKKAGTGLFDKFKDQAFKNAPRLTNRIAKAMHGVSGFVEAAGKGFGKFAKAIVDSVTGPEFKQFTDAFAVVLPGMMRKLGEIFGNVFEGLGGILTGSIPIANRFLNWLTQITDKFSEWANSAKGQTEIQDFLQKAGDSAKVLGGFLANAAEFLNNLLLSGQDTGDSLFQSMADQLQRMTDWLAAHPDDVKQWFADAKTFAESLGTAIGDIKNGIDKLDTPTNRVIATQMVEAIGKVITACVTLIGWISQIGVVVLTLAGFFATAWGGIIKIVLNAIDVILTGLALLPFGVGGVSDEMLGHFHDFKDGAIADVEGVNSTIESMKNLAEAGAGLKLDTSEATAKVNALHQLVENLFGFMGHPPAMSPPRSPTSVEAGVNQGGAPSGTTSSDDTRDPTTPKTVGRGGVTINVTTTTADPVGVANETVNRLVGVGYAS